MTITKPDISQVVYGAQSLPGYLSARGQLADAYHRSIVGMAPLRDPDVDHLRSTYDYSHLYPQAIAFDDESGELFVLRSPIGGGTTFRMAWVQVYDFPSMQSKRIFSLGKTFGQGLIVRWEGDSRVLYQPDNAANKLWKLDITTLPDQYAIEVPTDMGIDCWHEVAYDPVSERFLVQERTQFHGNSRKGFYALYDGDWNRLGSLRLPIEISSDFQVQAHLPKVQQIALFDGCIVTGCGTGWRSPPSTGYDPDIAEYQQGIQAITYNGERILTALCRPDKALDIFNQHQGYEGNVIENEGLGVFRGDLYALWATYTGNDSGALSRGFVITREISTAHDRIDFRPAASLPQQFNSTEFMVPVHTAATQLANPLTGEPLDSFASIVAFVRSTGLSRYTFSGFGGQTLVDLNSVPVDINSCLVEVISLNGSSFLIEVTTLDPAKNRRWWLATNGTAQVELGQAGGWHRAGTGSPEGVVAAPVGSVYSRIDGGVGTSLYVKEGGVGTTGWTAK